MAYDAHLANRDRELLLDGSPVTEQTKRQLSSWIAIGDSHRQTRSRHRSGPMTDTPRPRRGPDSDAQEGADMVPAATHNGAPDILAQARAALRDIVPSLATLVRSVPDANSVSIGNWTVSDVASHLSHVFRFDTDALAARPVPEATVTPAGMAEINAKMLAEDGERDPAVLADHIGALAHEFDDVASRPRAATVDWLQGTRLPPSTVAYHLIEECLVVGTTRGPAWERDLGRPP